MNWVIMPPKRREILMSAWCSGGCNYLKDLLEKDTQTTVRELVVEINVSVGSIWLVDLRAN